jgi:hypothetical protein
MRLEVIIPVIHNLLVCVHMWLFYTVRCLYILMPEIY